MCDIVESGHKKKSNFSHTFNLLSQYLKDNPTSFGDLTLGSGMVGSPGGINNLFPAKSGGVVSIQQQQQQEIPKKKEASSQMTIFYGGEVIVLDDFPADKVMEIINIADNWITKPQHKQVHPPLPLVAAVSADLPIARKASLARFLLKRKERITARAPYHGSSPSKQDQEGKPWLGLAAASAAESRGQFQAQS